MLWTQKIEMFIRQEFEFPSVLFPVYDPYNVCKKNNIRCKEDDNMILPYAVESLPYDATKLNVGQWSLWQDVSTKNRFSGWNIFYLWLIKHCIALQMYNTLSL